MLSEEALVLLVAAGACVSLALGVLALIRPPRPRVLPLEGVPAPGATVPGHRADGRTGLRAQPAPKRPAPKAASDDDPPIGSRIDRYRVAAKLGAGPLGTVYRAEDERTGHPVAIRLLPRGLARTSGTVAATHRVERSILAASSAHPALVHVLQLGEAEGGRLFVATELIEGRRLSEILADGGALAVREALRLALDLAGAVELLHDLGLVHGAIRPRNVMVLDDGRVKLMDAELSALRAAPAPAPIVAARPPSEYRAPELIRGATASEPADVYAFAAVVYEMLCGVPPFSGPTRETVLARHLTETPIPMRRRRRAVPAAVERFVAHALDKRPEVRPPMRDLVKLLKAEASEPDDTRARASRPGRGIAGCLSWLRRGASRRVARPQPPSEVRERTVATPRPITEWLADGQDVVGRILPGLIGDCNRLREALDVGERERARHRRELDELRSAVEMLRVEVETRRAERAETIRAVGDVLEVLKRLEAPLAVATRRTRARALTSHALALSDDLCLNRER